ncbi:MAG: hypothetical protein IT518_14485 [Burkholderiales bacterium]|nr:hypothetical protein [Burkholderiales bacterium]
MNVRRTMLVAASLALAGAAHGHDCSGGTADGGMDATGVQCNDVAAVVVAPSPSATQDSREHAAARKLLAAGLAAYEKGHDVEAVAYFLRAGETGDARSAEILALMYRLGPKLFPIGVSADPILAAKWAAVAAEARRREASAAMASRVAR